MREIVIDFETANPNPRLLEDAGAWRYAEDDRTEILCCVFSPAPGELFTWAPNRRGVEKLLRDWANDPDTTFVIHGEFEIPIWEKIMVPKFKFPPFKGTWHDIMAVAATKGLPLSLENLCEALHVPVQKDMEGRSVTLALADEALRSDEAIARVIRYCGIDVEAEWAVHKVLGPLPPEEREAYKWQCKMNRHGLRLDRPLIAKSQEVVDKATPPLTVEFFGLTELMPTQNVALAKFFGFKNTKGKLSVDKETVEWALANAELTKDQRRALEIRQLLGSTSIKKLPSMAASICRDGRSRGLSQFHGTQPGRNAGRIWQPYNLPRPTFEGFSDPVPADVVVDAIMTGDPEYVEVALGTPPIETVKNCLRHILIPDDGKVLMGADYAGIQLRILLALAKQWDKLKLITDGGDPYCDMASLIYKRTITKADKEERHMGKCAVLGLGFGMGWRRFQGELRKIIGKRFDDEFCQEVVRVYREEWAPKVPQLWYKFNNAGQHTIRQGKKWPREQEGFEWCAERLSILFGKQNGYLTVQLPSGRKLWYLNPIIKTELIWLAETPEGKRVVAMREEEIPDRHKHLRWEQKGNDRVFCDVVKNGRLKSESAHGARMCENIVMGIEVDIQRKGWANAEEKGFDIVHDCYDELITEVEEWQADTKTFRDCLLDQDEWVDMLRIPVDVPLDEMWVGKRYRK